ncbi:MAG: acyl-CoA thioesterase II, partial [Pseudomonadota bacterium]
SRDGGSFTTRRVIAIQHGKQIFNMACSFHVAEEGWEHQHDMPDVEGPEGLQSSEQHRIELADRIPEKFREEFTRPRAVEMREIDPMHLLDPTPKPDVSHLWFKVARAIKAEPYLHHCLLAYASDMRLLGTAQRPHGVSWMTGEVMGASLDHSMWFHAPVDFSEWLLYSMDAPYAGGARSFNRGSVFSRDGKLVASVAQEGLMRPMNKKR